MGGIELDVFGHLKAENLKGELRKSDGSRVAIDVPWVDGEGWSPFDSESPLTVEEE